MPVIGLGTLEIKNSETIYTALKNGYRHFDTATRYGNEEFVGEALKRGI